MPGTSTEGEELKWDQPTLWGCELVCTEDTGWLYVCNRHGLMCPVDGEPEVISGPWSGALGS